jgi:RND superfamily putative drug exporter
VLDPEATKTQGARNTNTPAGTMTTGGARSRNGSVLRRRPTVGVIWRAYGVIIVALRYPIVLGWIVAAAATVYLPGIASSGAISNLIPHGAPALRAENDAARLFGLPLTAEVAVVQRDPRGFSTQTQMTAARRAVALDDRRTRINEVAAALPIANPGRAFPGSRERSARS